MSMVFGPVHSRRLGVSLGVNNIPYKICSYTCVYCQLGRTLRLSIKRRPYSVPHELLAKVSSYIENISIKIDYITFVPDGEPTLDTMLGEDLKLLRSQLDAKTAVLTNASLLFKEEVRRDLSNADYVSIKVDAGDEDTWRKIDRPHPQLDFKQVIEGIKRFTREYSGALVTETMLVQGINDTIKLIEKTASLIAEINPQKAYIAIPVRPPAEPWVRPPELNRILQAYEIFREKGVRSELLSLPEPPPPPPSNISLEKWVLETVRVHPLPLEYVEGLARERGLDMGCLLERLAGEHVRLVDYSGRRFLVFRLYE